MKKIKWKDLTPEQLEGAALDIDDHVHDMKSERDIIAEEQGYDLVGVLEAVARRCRREAKRRGAR